MDTTNARPAQPRQFDLLRSELLERIGGAVAVDGSIEPLPGLHLNRVSQRIEPVHSLYRPAFCVIAQGSKELVLAGHRYRYDPAHYLIVSAELPVSAHVIEASAAQPYLSLRLDLDPALVSAVMVEAEHAPPRRQGQVKAIDVRPIDPDLLDAVVRLVRLVDAPDAAPFLMPLVLREIVYRLLMGNQGDRLRHLAVFGGARHRMVRAMERLRRDFDQPLRIELLASELGMSVSSFHHHFKAVTAMSPLQFQKQVRLQEARRLLLGEELDATSAGLRVGYDDASHFSRDYKRLFGEPPMRDVSRLREAVTASPNL